MNSSHSTSPFDEKVSRPSVTLQIVSGPHEGEQRRFTDPSKLVIGRGRDAHWRLQRDPFFSRHHFRVEADPPECRLRDLNSANGTCVNGVRIQDILLKDGDRIECGTTWFAVSISVGPDQADTPTLQVPPERRIDPAAMPGPNTFPRRIAEFELTRELGRGGMGIVYHAFQRPSGREAAVKTILPTALMNAVATQLFLREASILTRLAHKRIVECLGMGIHDEQMYFAMEYLPVVDFPKVLATYPRAKQIRLACGIVCRVLEGLQYAHERDIVHRDVKPSNILVYQSDAGMQVKLADFGLAKNYASAGFTAISAEKMIRGTLGFASPEQLDDSRHAKPPCDIYSVGASLYFYLSGRMPLDLTERAAQAAVPKRIPLASRAADLPAELCAAVDRALAIDPLERYSSADHMRRALLKFAGKP
jgi:eukaryotic-like serine/threonine-protein kinase